VAPDPAGDDSAHYTLDPLFSPRFVDWIQPNTGGGSFLESRRLPRGIVNPLGTLRDRANPFRGRAAPVLAGAAVRTRFYEGDPDPRLADNGGPIVPVNPLDPTPAFDPVYLPLLEIFPATDRDGTPYMDLGTLTVDVAIPQDSRTEGRVLHSSGKLTLRTLSDVENGACSSYPPSFAWVGLGRADGTAALRLDSSPPDREQACDARA